jgi:hypothetical protein
MHLPLSLSWALVASLLNRGLPNDTVLYADTAFRPLSEALLLHHQITLRKNGDLSVGRAVIQAHPCTIAVRVPMSVQIALQKEHFLHRLLPISLPMVSVSLSATLHTRLSWTVGGQLQSQTTLYDYHLQSPLSNLSPIDISKQLSAQLGTWLHPFIADLDRRLSDPIWLRIYWEQGWAALQQSLLVAESPALYLALRPFSSSYPPPTLSKQPNEQQLEIIPLLANDSGLHTACILDISAHIGELEQLPPVLPLPFSFPQSTSATPATPATIPLTAQCSYVALSEALTQQYRAQGLSFGGFSIPVERVHIYADANSGSRVRLCIAVRISLGGALGEITIQGHPYWDSNAQTLHAPDLDYTITEGNMIFRAALQLLRPALSSAMRRQKAFALHRVWQQWQNIANQYVAQWQQQAAADPSNIAAALLPRISLSQLRADRLHIDAQNIQVSGSAQVNWG